MSKKKLLVDNKSRMLSHKKGTLKRKAVGKRKTVGKRRTVLKRRTVARRTARRRSATTKRTSHKSTVGLKKGDTYFVETDKWQKYHQKGERFLMFVGKYLGMEQGKYIFKSLREKGLRVTKVSLTRTGNSFSWNNQRIKVFK